MKRSAELANLRQLCSLGLPLEAVIPAFLRALRAVVPCDFGAFFWIDAHGDMTQMYSEKMLSAEATARYFKTHYESAAHRFRERVLAQARAGEVVRPWSVDAQTASSDYYREILEPLGVDSILYALVVQKSAPQGQLSLYRGRGARPFSAEECETVQAATRYLALAMTVRSRSDIGGPGNSFRDSGQAALLVCSSDGRVLQASGRGHALLAQASGCRINRHTIVSELEQAGLALIRRALAAIARAGDEGGAELAPIRNEWGRFRVRAYGIGDDGHGVLIERQEHLLIRLLDAMRALNLSAKQREVALLLARGLTNPQIAVELGVKLNTASYHVKQLFAKLDAHDRSEAIARIFEGHTARN